MSAKFLIRRPTPYVRIFIGAGITVLGMVIISEFNEAVGVACLLIGLMVGIRGAAGPVLGVVFSLTYFSLVVAWLYWIQPHTDGWTFDEWAQQYWGWIIYSAVIVFAPIITMLRKKASAWKTLQIDFSIMPEPLKNLTDSPAIGGQMRVDDEMINVNTAVTNLGILVVQDSGEHLFFSWDRVKEIRIADHIPNYAYVEVVRRTINPLKFGIPWHQDLSRKIPPSVRQFGV